jgi:PhzF family phenazine biosynthesis protein
VKVSIVNSFTLAGKGGNGAGVVIVDKLPDVEIMQSVAKKAGFSETAFICPNGDSFVTRFYTPECEVDLCGHATIAAFYLLARTGQIAGCDGVKSVVQETKAGNLKVYLFFEGNQIGRVFMEQSPPQRLGVVDGGALNRLCQVLGIKREEVGLNDVMDVAPEIISTGLPDIIFPVRSKRILNSIKPDFTKLALISKELKVVGVHVFTFETEYPHSTVQCRNFGPAVGIDEESATGTSNGALGYYLYSKGMLKGREMKSEQGFSMGKPSLIYVRIEGNTVMVGGEAVKVGEIDVDV